MPLYGNDHCEAENWVCTAGGGFSFLFNYFWFIYLIHFMLRLCYLAMLVLHNYFMKTRGLVWTRAMMHDKSIWIAKQEKKNAKATRSAVFVVVLSKWSGAEGRVKRGRCQQGGEGRNGDEGVWSFPCSCLLSSSQKEMVPEVRDIKICWPAT